MSRYRGDWDDDFYAGEPRPRRRDEGPEFGPPRGRYEYDERDAARGGRPFGVRGDYDDTAYGRATAARMESVAWAGLKASAGERDRAKSWLDTYVDLASSPAALARLEGLLDGKPEALDGIDAGLVDQELRWDIVQRLSRFGLTVRP